MTYQEIFDKVATHLLTQNARSWAPSFPYRACAYRGIGGLKCAIGCLIPDERYSVELEGKAASSPLVMSAVGVPAADTDLGSFLRYLQGIHDGADVRDWTDLSTAVLNRLRPN